MTNLWEKYIKHISVSQLKTHDNNPRRWALEKLVGLPTADSPYTQIGREIHDALETPYDTTNTADHVVKCVDAYKEYLAESGVRPIATEVEFRLKLDKDLPPILGYIDVLAETEDGEPLVIDHKTSASGSTFLKEGDLEKDIQLLTYALFVLTNTPYSGIWVQHNQYKYRNKKKILTVIREYVKMENLLDFAQQLRQKIRTGILKSIEQYDTLGIMGVPYKPNTSRWPCELESVCQGKVSPELYSEIYNSLDKPVYREALIDALDSGKKFEFDSIDLTKLESPDTIVVDKKSSEDTMLKLVDVMAVARNKHKDISNTWDRREAMTKSVVDYVQKQGKDIIVLLPTHFIGGSLDPEYSPIVTQLKELKIPVAVEL